MLIFKKNPTTNEIKEFANIKLVGCGYEHWVDATQPEIDAYNLEKAKTSAEYILETERKKEQYESITYNGKTYWATQTAQINIFAAQVKLIIHILTEAGLMKPEVLGKFKQEWLDENNQKVILQGVDINSMFVNKFDEVCKSYIQEAEKQNIVKDAVNVSQIQGVLPAGSYDVSLPTNEAPNGAFNTQLEPASGLENKN